MRIRIKLALTGLLLSLIMLVCGGGGGTTCSVKCQHITDDTQWEQCMLDCHAEMRE